MADADEDLILPSTAPSSHPNPSAHMPSTADSDDEDGTPSFSAFLSLMAKNSRTTSSRPAASALPRRGEKDFEPHGTTAQADVLANSRMEMHDALAFTRVHQPGKRVLGVYVRETGLTRVERPSGKLFLSMGRTDRKGVLWLEAEEALYLVERGDLDVRWEVEDEGEKRGGEGNGCVEEGGDDDAERPFVTFSLQTAYAVYVGDTEKGVSLERYNVYANLKRGGYAVFRGPAWEPQDFDKDAVESRALSTSTAGNGAWAWLYALLSTKDAKFTHPPHGPLHGAGPFRSYQDIYKQLGIVPWHDPTIPTTRESGLANDEPQGPDDALRVSYYVYKPREGFRKSKPGPPDFRIAVIDAREEDVPTIDQIDGLLASTPYAPPPPPPDNDNAGKMYVRLKHGYRNVILAVVDQGIISYLRIADAGFGKEKLYAGAGRSKFGFRGGKRGGRGGGRGGRGGRGRGRGG